MPDGVRDNAAMVASELRNKALDVERKGGKHLVIPTQTCITIANLIDTLIAKATHNAADRIDELEATLRKIVADSDGYSANDQNGEAAAARFYGAIARSMLPDEEEK